MKIKCQKCGKEATLHVTEIVQGQKIEKHLCQQCAGQEGITVQVQVPLAQVLEDLLQSAAGKEMANLRCDVCGISFLEFRQKGLLGCPNDYAAFEQALLPLLERAHEGNTRHVGHVPGSAGENQRRQNELLRLRAELKDAVASEQYERAVHIRDRIKELEVE